MSSLEQLASSKDMTSHDNEDGGGANAASTSTTATPTATANNDIPSDEDSKPAAKKRTPKSTANKKKSVKKKSPPKNGGDTKTPAAAKKPPKKTMTEMAQEAIMSLGDRTGSSSIAIGKYILENYEHLEKNKTFKSRLNLALKSAVKTNKFTKVRNSYKLNAAYAKKERDKKKKQGKQKNDAQVQQEEEKKRIAAEKRQLELEASMTPEELAELRKQQAKERQVQRKKDAAAKLVKERQERIRRRRFPMEDTKLHSEDAELGVKPPSDVTRRPSLPYFFHATLALDDSRRKGKTPASILTPSKVDHLEYGSRGLVPDLLQVYHFFRGDVHFTLEKEEAPPLVPEFGLDHVMYAVEEVLNGNAKKSRLVPPLISHLFVTSLKLLTMKQTAAAGNETVHERRLRKDLSKLSSALSPASWGEVCVLYMDAMERYYTSSASVDPNVLPSGKIDVQYLMRATDIPEPITPAVAKKPNDDDMEEEDGVALLPEGYCGYLGNPHGTLAIAHAKLQKQDPWNLRAEELMALLGALTDDILACSPDIADDLARRDAEMYELLKAKRNADSHYRKIKLAFEGPKNPSRSRANEKKKEAEAFGEAKESEETASGKKGKGSKENQDNTGNSEKAPPKFKPTATQKQFESAAKAQQKAHDAYEKGLRTLTARTEPVGYDRNFNAVYYFNHDPDKLYVELSKPASTADDDYLPPDMLLKKYSWHVIETKSLFDSYTSSLDTRGKRESNLYDELVGPGGGHYSLKRGLYDDLKEKADQAARLRQREDLDRRLENAKIACLAEEEDGGRRSGRLHTKAQTDLAEVEEEIEKLEKRIASDAVPVAPDYEELTGLKMLTKFDKAGGRRQTRRSRERKEDSETGELPEMLCTKLIPTGDIDGSGLVGLVVSKMLALEETCEALSPWERSDTSRASWIADLEERAHAWSSSAEVVIGPSNADDASEVGSDSFGTPASTSKRSARTPGSVSSAVSKRRRLDDGSPASTSSSSYASPSQILAQLKTPLMDLEQRVYEITGLAMATHDADEADDNMSASSEDKRSRQEEKKKLAWKKKINALRIMDGRMHVQVREAVVEAITAARKAHFSSIVTKLRSALLLHQPHAAGECKEAALAVLDNHGGYHEEDLDESDDESIADEEMAEEEEDVPSALSIEAMALTGNLGGDDDADRVDWINGVKNCKTLSRWAALASSLLENAETLLGNTIEESDALWDSLKRWEKEEDRLARSRAGKVTRKKKDQPDPTEVWANVRYTNEFCMAKVDDSPYWPAKKCEAKDKELASKLHSVGRSLVSLIGENGGLRAVKLEEVRPFDGNVIEGDDLDEAPKNIRTQLDECMVMTRRIVRGRKPSSSGGYREEKKMAM